MLRLKWPWKGRGYWVFATLQQKEVWLYEVRYAPSNRDFCGARHWVTLFDPFDDVFAHSNGDIFNSYIATYSPLMGSVEDLLIKATVLTEKEVNSNEIR